MSNFNSLFPNNPSALILGDGFFQSMEMHISYASIIEKIMEELCEIDKSDVIKDKKLMENFLQKKGIIKF